jgi:hypothetical protein
MKLKTKLGISFISIASVMLYVGCSSSDSSTSAPEDLVANTLADLPNCTESREGKTAVLLEDKSTYLCTEGKWTFVSAAIDEVESLDDLLNCTSKIEGDSVQVKEESAIYVCSDGEWEKWRVLTDTLSTADDLLACVSKREGNTAFVTEENALYECVDGGWEKIVTYMKTVSSQEKLFNCTSKNEGDSSYVSNENTVYLCISESWRELGELGTVSDSLPNCTEKREGERVFLSEEHVTLICNANKWKRFDIFSAIEEEENSEPESSSSENEWEDYEPVAQCEEKKLSKACLQGEWYFSTLDGAMLSFAGTGTLKFTGSEFSYTPAIADLAHTYCPGTELEGTYDIISLTQIKLTVGGIRLYDCFIGKKEIIVNATISENELRLSGIEESPFVPNDEGLKTEIYNRTEDSSSNAEESTSSSSAAPIEMSSASEVSPVVMGKLGADVMTDGQGGEMVQLKGTISLDYGDNFNIDSLRFIAGHVENGIVYESPLRVPMTITFPTDRIALGTSTAKIQLAPLEGCGDFRIYVWAYASASEEGGLDVSKVPVYSSVDSVDFVKACPKEEVSSSSVDAACTEVVATEVTLSNILETDQYAINLVTGLAENPHLTLEIVDNMAYFQAAPGVEIWEEETQDFGLLPESPVCLESFKILFGTQANRLVLMGNMWLYIKTPEGYFPMMLGKVRYQDEKTGSVTITYYK